MSPINRHEALLHTYIHLAAQVKLLGNWSVSVLLLPSHAVNYSYPPPTPHHPPEQPWMRHRPSLVRLGDPKRPWRQTSREELFILLHSGHYHARLLSSDLQ